MSMQQIIGVLHPDTKKMVVNTREKMAQAVGLGRILTKIAIFAYNHFINKNFRAFDALVGDTQCQIRAAKVVHLSQTSFPNLALRIHDLEEVRDRFAGTFAPKKQSMVDFFQTLLDPEVDDPHLFFLFMCHLLFLVRDPLKPTESKHSELLLGETAHQTHLKKLMFRVKEELARDSVQYIQSIVQEHPDEMLKAIVGPDGVVVKADLPRISLYFGMRILMDFFKEATVIRIHQEGNIIEIPLGTQRFDAKLVIEAESLPGVDLRHVNFVEDILVNAAQHYQFIGGDNDPEIPHLQGPLLQEFNRHRSMTPAFSVKHVFAEAV